jgi:cell division protein FtsB
MTTMQDKMLASYANLQEQVRDLRAENSKLRKEVELWKAKHQAVESIAFELTAALKRLGVEENEPPW